MTIIRIIRKVSLQYSDVYVCIELEEIVSSNVADILKQYRALQKISQAELSERLGVTQATVSRVESGKQDVSRSTLEKIKKLVGKVLGSKIQEDEIGLDLDQDLSESVEFDFSEAPIFGVDESYRMLVRPESKVEGALLKEGLNYSFTMYEVGGVGGDIVKVTPNTSRNSMKSIFILGDAVGHGWQSAYMSFALEFGYETLMSTYREEIISPVLLESALNSAILKTSNKWKGEPSLIMGTVNYGNSAVDFINRGMPHPILRRGSEVEYLRESRYKAIDLIERSIQAKQVSSIELNLGDSIMFYSDGLIDLIDEGDLLTDFKSASGLFKGDSKAISKSIQRSIEKYIKLEHHFADDVSFLIISKSKKRKRKV